MYMPTIFAGVCVREKARTEGTNEKANPPVRVGTGTESEIKKCKAENGTKDLTDFTKD